MFNNPNPKEKLKLIGNNEETRAIKSIMSIIDGFFGFNYTIEKGHVTEIQLISTGLVIIPRQLSYLKNLIKIQLPSNKIKKLRNLDRCKSVEVLNLSDNQITTGKMKELTQMIQLKSLNLSMNRIDSLKPLSLLKNLESLKISCNYIEEIPILGLSHLKYLDLSENKISKLKNLHTLENLINVKLQNNCLSEDEKLVLSSGIDEIKNYCKKKASNSIVNEKTIR